MPEPIDDTLTIPLPSVPRCAVCGEVQFTPEYNTSSACPGCIVWATQAILKKLGLTVEPR